MDKKKLLQLLNEDGESKGTYTKHSKVLIIDGLNLFFRNFAMINLINEDGIHIGGLSGFLRSLGSLINQIQPTSVYIVFDGPGSSNNRKNLIPEYKSGRGTTRITNFDSFNDLEHEDEAKINQITRLIHYLKCLPIKVISLPKVEADDIMAYLSNILVNQNDSHCIIVSSDKDFLQLISNKITIYRPIEKAYFTPSKFQDTFDFQPKNYILYKTLVGDNSDKVKGVKGLGKGKILKFFPELKERILTLDDIFTISEEKMKENKIYPQILLNRNQIENEFKIMNLHKPLLDENEKEQIHELIKSPINILNVEIFMRLYNEDMMGNAIRNTNKWLLDTFNVLKSFK